MQTKQKMQGLDALQAYVGSNALSKEQCGQFMDVCGQLLQDNNYKIVSQTLEILEEVITAEPVAVRPYTNNVIPHVVERLGDAKQSVRRLACSTLVAFMKVHRSDVLLEKLSRYWSSRNWKIRHGLLQFVAEAVTNMGPEVLNSQEQEQSLMSQILGLMEDPESTVRDAVIESLEEIYRHLGEVVLDAIEESNVRPAQLRLIRSRLQQIELPVLPMEATAGGYDTATAPYGDQVYRLQQQHAARPPSSHGDSVPEDASGVSEISRNRKKGGYKDGGGVTENGELLPAKPLYVANDRELRGELERLRGALLLTVDWDRRVEALQRLEGLVKGGAASVDGFMDMMRPFLDALVEQIKDRRSAVSRQACHFISVLAGALGPRFETWAVPVFSAVSGVLPITVQVMAEAADSCAHAIIQHCPAPRLLATVADNLLKSKNAKIRQCCGVYLVEVLEGWDPAVYHKSMDLVENSIIAAARDAVSDTREAGRRAFAAYNATFPHRATALLKRVDAQLQDKLAQAARSYQPGSGTASVAIAAHAAAVSRAPSITPKPQRAPVPALHHLTSLPRPGSVSSLPESDAVSDAPSSHRTQTARAPYAWQQEGAAAEAPLPNGREPHGRGRRSLAGNAMRVPGHQELYAEPSVASTTSTAPERVERQPSAAARRTSSAVGLPAARVLGTPDEPQTQPQLTAAAAAPAAAPHAAHVGASTASEALRQPATANRQDASVGAAAMPPQPPMRTTRQSNVYGGRLEQQQQQLSRHATMSNDLNASFRDQVPAAGGAAAAEAARPTLTKIVNIIAAGPRNWTDKVDAYTSLAQALSTLGSEPGDASADIARVVPHMVAGLEDAHLKVLLAVLEAVYAALNAATRLLEPYLERLIPPLFLKITDPKDPVKRLSTACLEACPQLYHADVILPALLRSLECVKQPKGKVGILEFCSCFIGEGLPAGRPSSAGQVRQLLSKVVPLLLDKNPDIRRVSTELLASMYGRWGMPDLILAHQQVAGGSEVLAMQRALEGALAAGRQQQQQQQLQLQEYEQGQYEQERYEQQGEEQEGGEQELLQEEQDAQTGASGSESGSPVRHYITGLQPTTTAAPGSPATAAVAAPQAPSPPRAAPAATAAVAHPAATAAWQPQRIAPADPLGAATAASTAQGLHYMQPSSSAQYTLPAQVPLPAQMRNGSSGSPGTTSYITERASTERANHSERSNSGATTSTAPHQISSDPQLQSRQLALLLHRLQTSTTEDVLARLAAFAAAAGEAAWASNFTPVLVAVLQASRHEDPVLREEALLVVRALARHQPRLFEPLLNMVVPSLLTSCGDPSKEVVMAAGKCLDDLLAAMPPHRSLDILALKLPSADNVAAGTAADDNTVLCACIRCLRQVVARMAPAELLPRVTADLLPGLYAAWGHEQTDVRKAVVFCLVDLWCCLGEQLTPHLTRLPPDYLKLLTIYFNRRQDQKQQSGAAAIGVY